MVWWQPPQGDQGGVQKPGSVTLAERTPDAYVPPDVEFMREDIRGELWFRTRKWMMLPGEPGHVRITTIRP